MIKKLLLFFLLIVLGIAVNLSFFAREAPEPAKAAQIFPVTVAVAERQDVGVYLDALGTVVPVSTIDVVTQVGGIIKSLNFKEGGKVKKHQLIASIDSRELEAKLKAAKGQLVRDQALLQDAKIDLDRYKQAVQSGSVKQQTVDSQDALVNQYKGAILSDQGAVDDIMVQLDYTKIRSPIDGQIGLRQIDSGNFLQVLPGQSVAKIVSISPTTVEFPIAEDDVKRVKRALTHSKSLHVLAMDRDRKTVLGRGNFFALDNMVDLGTGTIKVRAKFENEEGNLIANQFVNARLQIGFIKDAIVVPENAIRHGKGGDYLYVIGPDQTAVMHKVTMGPATRGDYVVVKDESIKDGDEVVVSGSDRLFSGAKIHVDARKPLREKPAKDSAKEHADSGKSKGEKKTPEENADSAEDASSAQSEHAASPPPAKSNATAQSDEDQ
jgi:multidrug efflux system membrane fusion protein